VQNGVSSSENVFGPTSIVRVVTPSVPAGTAVLADWDKVRLAVREDMRIDVDTAGTLFTKNAAVLRAEVRLNFQYLRPTAIAVCDLTA
jgi:hypothetical protein